MIQCHQSRFSQNSIIVVRKMCGVVPAILARGPLRAPVASPRPLARLRH